MKSFPGGPALRLVFMAIALGSILFVGDLRADSVHLRNGQTVYGQITGQTRTRASDIRTTSDYLFRGVEMSLGLRQGLGGGFGVFFVAGIEEVNSSQTNTRAHSIVEVRSDIGLDPTPVRIYAVTGTGFGSSGIEGNLFGNWNKVRQRERWLTIGCDLRL